jgi:hypothetical protein
MSVGALMGPLLGGAASAVVGWGMNRLAGGGRSQPQAQPMPRFEMPEYKPPVFNFEIPKYDPPTTEITEPKTEELPTPAPTPPIDQSTTNAAVIAKKKAKEDTESYGTNDQTVLTKPKDRLREKVASRIKRTTLLG